MIVHDRTRLTDHLVVLIWGLRSHFCSSVAGISGILLVRVLLKFSTISVCTRGKRCYTGSNFKTSLSVNERTLAFYLFSAVTLGSAVMVITARNPVHSVFFLILAFFSSAGLFILLHAEFLAMMLVVVYVGAVAVLFLFVVMMLDIKRPEVKPWFVPKTKFLALSSLWFLAYMISFTLFVGGTIALAVYLIQLITGRGVDLFTPDPIVVSLVLLSLVFGGGLTEFFFKKVCHKSWGKIFKAFCQSVPIGAIVLGILIIEALVVTHVWLRPSDAEEILMAPAPPDMVLSNTHALGQLIYTDFIYVFQSVGLVLLVAMIGAIVLTLRRRPDVKRQKVSDQIQRSREDAVRLTKVESGQGIGG